MTGMTGESTPNQTLISKVYDEEYKTAMTRSPSLGGVQCTVEYSDFDNWKGSMRFLGCKIK